MPYPLATLVAALAMMFLCWLASLYFDDVSIVDILWAPAFAVIAWICAAMTPPAPATRGWLALALVSLWAARLGGHVWLRWRRLGREDYRYAAIRKAREPHFRWTSLFWIFGLQAVLLWIVSWPLQATVAATAGFDWLDGVGGALALMGIAMEGLADVQLARFRAVPANAHSVLDSGLWAWSRHPNYFGDFLLWWGFGLMALGGGAPWWVLFGPVVMSALLLHFSGVGLLEETIPDRRPDYRRYMRETSAFVPWPPRRRNR